MIVWSLGDVSPAAVAHQGEMFSSNRSIYIKGRPAILLTAGRQQANATGPVEPHLCVLAMEMFLEYIKENICRATDKSKPY